MDANKFAPFLQARRKEQGMTQAQLGEKLGVTDKAISRWERGVGLPDISLLEPLAEALEISLVELMRCERIETKQLEIQEVETMMAQTIDLAQELTRTKWRSRLLRFVALPLISVVWFFLMGMITWYVREPFWLRTACLAVVTICHGLAARAVGFVAKCEYLNPPKPIGKIICETLTCIGMLVFAMSWLLNTDGLRHLYCPVGMIGFNLMLVYPGYLVWRSGRDTDDDGE